MYQIRKSLRPFCAAHRLLKDYPGRCRNLHGHNYEVTIIFQSRSLNRFDFVIDFVDVRELFEKWIKLYIDHGVIVSEDDAVLLKFLRDTEERHFVLPNHKNTSAECLAEFFFHQFTQLLSDSELDAADDVEIIAVEVAETSESSAIYCK